MGWNQVVQAEKPAVNKVVNLSDVGIYPHTIQSQQLTNNIKTL